MSRKRLTEQEAETVADILNGTVMFSPKDGWVVLLSHDYKAFDSVADVGIMLSREFENMRHEDLEYMVQRMY